jgi:hypothetical protein
MLRTVDEPRPRPVATEPIPGARLPRTSLGVSITVPQLMIIRIGGGHLRRARFDLRCLYVRQKLGEPWNALLEEECGNVCL